MKGLLASLMPNASEVIILSQRVVRGTNLYIECANP